MEMEIINCHQLSPDKNHMELLKYIIYNKINELQKLLDKKQCDINYIYGKPFEKTIVEIACLEYSFKIEPKCVLILLKHGADAEMALTSAAKGGNPKLLKVILEYFKDPKINYDIKNSKVILKMIPNINTEIQEKLYAGCVQLLIKFGVNINLKSKLKCTAVYLAAKNNYAHIVNAILESKVVDLDSYRDYKLRTARDIILTNKLNIKTLPPPMSCTKNKIFLESYIDLNDEYTFITEYTIMKNSNKIETKYEKDLFIYAIKKGSITIVRYMMCTGIDINSYNLKRIPLYVACKKGYYKMVKILMEYSNPKLISETFVLMVQTVYFHEVCLDEMDINHEKCFTMLLNSKKLDINYKIGDPPKSALYYAIKNQPKSLVINILEKGASLALLDLDDSRWTVFVSPEVLETHLNKCITIDKIKEKSNEMSISVNFSTLITKVTFNEVQDTNEESESTTFLNQNYKQHGNNSKEIIESKVLEYMCDKSEYYSVLQHPLIHIFMYLKWQKFRLFFYSNLVFHLLYSVSLISYLVLPYFDYKNTVILSILFNFIVIAISALSLRELIQLCMTKLDYFKNYENLLDIVLISLTIILLCVENKNSAIFKQLSAFVIIFTTMESISILGRHIDFLFSTITMLTSVTMTLLKFMLPFFILIIAFSFSFFIIFQKETSEDTNRNLEKENLFFSNPGLSLFKTSLMLTGEFDAGEIDFSSYPITSPLLFILFVFLMNIVLFGVFTALAINDIQQIKEIQSQIMKIKQIIYMDKLLKNVSQIYKKFNLQKSMVIQMDLEHSKLYMKNQKYPIQVHKRVVDTMKKIIEEKKELSQFFVNQCPGLQHTILKKRKVNRFSNANKYKFV